jgi:hypothetical protein
MMARTGDDSLEPSWSGNASGKTNEAGSRSNPVASIAACVVCHNEADRLGDCLASVAWTDEILVMDLESTDDSSEIATRQGARVLHRPRVAIVELVRNELAASARGDWILVLDPDERITEGLAHELRRAAARPDIDAVFIPRMNYDLGYPPSHPIHRYEPQLRMYRRSAVSWPTIPNALPKVPPERLLRLPGRDDLVITHYRSRNIPEILDRWIRYAPAQAQSMIDAGQAFTARGMIRTLWWSFHRQFVRGQGLRDGVPGLIRGAILLGFHFMVWACFWQLSGAQRTTSDDRLLRRLSLLVESVGRFGNFLLAPAGVLRRMRGPGSRTGRVRPE